MGKIDKVSPETLRSLARQLNVSDKENISLKADNCELELKIALVGALLNFKNSDTLHILFIFIP